MWGNSNKCVANSGNYRFRVVMGNLIRDIKNFALASPQFFFILGQLNL